MSDLAGFWVHTATVETLLGAGAYGDQFAAPVTVPCFAEAARKVVRQTSGEQVVSESTVYCDVSYAALFLTDSKVTVSGATARVIRTNTNDSAGLQLPDHVVVNLT